jgi:hypothetical protein
MKGAVTMQRLGLQGHIGSRAKRVSAHADRTKRLAFLGSALVPCSLAVGPGVMGIAVSPASAAAFVSQAQAQGVNLNALNGTASLALSNPPTSATSDGTSNDFEQNQPAVSGLSGVSWLTAGAVSEVAEADADGTSSACAGIVQPGAEVQLGTGRIACAATNTGSGGITIDLSQFSGLGSTIAGIADVKVRFDAVTAYATEDSSGGHSGSAQLLNGVVTADLVNGLGNLTLPLTIASGPNQSLLTAVDNALAGANDPLLAPLTSAIANVPAAVADVETNYQVMTPQGKFAVSALHISLLGGAGGVGDLAKVTVGPNTAPATGAPGLGSAVSSIGSGITSSVSGESGSTASNSLAASSTHSASTNSCATGSVVTGFVDTKPITWTLRDPKLAIGMMVIGRVMEGNRVVLSRSQRIGTNNTIKVIDAKPTDGILTGEIVVHHAVAVRLAVRPMAVATCTSAKTAVVHTATFVFHLPGSPVGSKVGGTVFSSGVKVQSFNVQVRAGHVGTFVDHSPLGGTLLAVLYRPGSRERVVTATTLAVSR